MGCTVSVTLTRLLCHPHAIYSERILACKPAALQLTPVAAPAAGLAAPAGRQQDDTRD